MKILLALRGSMTPEDREHLLKDGYDVTWVDDIDGIRAVDGTALRDYFAAAALQGYISGTRAFGYLTDAKSASKEAFEYADAMLAERSK